MLKSMSYRQILNLMFYRKRVTISAHPTGLFSAVIWMDSQHPITIQYKSLRALINEVCSIVRY